MAIARSRRLGDKILNTIVALTFNGKIKSPESLRMVKGFGPVKCKKYGSDIMEIIAPYNTLKCV